MPVVPKQTLPECFHRDCVKGVFVGGCVARGDGSSFRAKAHAHTKGDWKGWLCYRSSKRLTDLMLALHEIAHLIAECGHTDKWRKCLLSIGGTLDATPSLKSYHPKPRK